MQTSPQPKQTTQATGRHLKRCGRFNQRISHVELTEILTGLTSPNPQVRKTVYEKYPLWMRRTAVNIANLDFGKQGAAYLHSTCPVHKKQSLMFRYSRREGIRVHCGLCSWTTHFEDALWHSEKGLQLCGLSKGEGSGE